VETGSPDTSPDTSRGLAVTSVVEMSDDVARLEVAETPDGHGLIVNGEIDVHTSMVLKSAIEERLPLTGDFVLEMSDVGFIDSSGLRVLVDADATVKAGGNRLILAHLSSSVEKLFQISGLESHFDVQPD
jgi:anti-sigma B factor antagonist